MSACCAYVETYAQSHIVKTHSTPIILSTNFVEVVFMPETKEEEDGEHEEEEEEDDEEW